LLNDSEISKYALLHDADDENILSSSSKNQLVIAAPFQISKED
jgi:hypothetical protein